jgi:hypothetical protein
MRRLKKGIGKYKGKLPFMFLIVVKLVIFLPNVLMQGVQIVMKKKFLRNKRDKKINKRKIFKKSLYSKEDSSSFGEDNDGDSDSERVLFMEMETQEETLQVDDEYCEYEGQVDLEEELISALRDIKRERKKNKSLDK